MNLQILVPTVRKTKDDIEALCKSLNIKSDCVIANQNGVDEEYTFLHKSFTVRVICTNTVGVSKNRNILLKHLTAEVGLMLDDDCVMHSNYVEVISSFFEKHPDAEFVLFNGNLVDNGVAKTIHNRKTKRVTKYYQISYAGAPGLCFRKKSLDILNLKYDETLGVPNYIVAGEDTVFHNMILRKKPCFYRSSDVLFDINDNNSKSSYFNGVDKRYVETRGYVTFYIHPYLFFLYKVRHCLRFKKVCKSISFFKLMLYFKNGKKIFKNKENGVKQ